MSGLDGVVAADTVLSHVDGEAGELVVRGKAIDGLTGHLDFAAMAVLLWGDLAPMPRNRAALVPALGAARVAAARLVPGLLETAKGLSVVEGLRVGLALLPDQDGDSDALAAASAVPVFTTALSRARRKLAPLDPDPAADPASDFLRLLQGRDPHPAEAAALDAYLVTVADHGMNASTFAARVVASTRAGLISSVLAGLCALKGPLHGGAPGPVLDMLDAIGTPDNCETWLRAELGKGERLMGFGHRVYRTRDPRADVLKAALHRLAGARGGDIGRLVLAEQVERTALALLQEKQPGRKLDTNVEYYTALLLDAVGIPRDLFTPVFAMGRVLGWVAHVWEQEKSGRLIRPQARYIGAMPVWPTSRAVLAANQKAE